LNVKKVGTNNLRNRHNISQPANRLSKYQNSFFPSTIKTWNTLDLNIREVPTFFTFKKRLQSFGILIVCLLVDLYCDDFVDYSYSIRQLLGVSTLINILGLILEYGSEVWDNCGAVNSDRLEKVQTEAARIVTGLTSYASLDSIYCETGWV
jgi:hypothetical protein